MVGSTWGRQRRLKTRGLIAMVNRDTPAIAALLPKYNQVHGLPQPLALVKHDRFAACRAHAYQALIGVQNNPLGRNSGNTRGLTSFQNIKKADSGGSNKPWIKDYQPGGQRLSESTEVVLLQDHLKKILLEKFGGNKEGKAVMELLRKINLDGGYIHQVIQSGTTYTGTTGPGVSAKKTHHQAVGVLCADLDGVKQLADSNEIIQTDGTGMSKWITTKGGRKVMVITLLPGSHGQKVFFSGVMLYLLNCSTSDTISTLLGSVKALLQLQGGASKQPKAVKIDLDKALILAFKKVWPAIKIFFELFHIDAVVDTFCMGLGAEGAPLLAAMRAYRYSKSKEEAMITREFIKHSFGSIWEKINKSTLGLLLDYPESTCLYGRLHVDDRHWGPAEQEGFFNLIKNVYGMNMPNRSLADLIYWEYGLREEAKAKQLLQYEKQAYASSVATLASSSNSRDTESSTSGTKRKMNYSKKALLERRIQTQADRVTKPTAKDRRNAFTWVRKQQKEDANLQEMVAAVEKDLDEEESECEASEGESGRDESDEDSCGGRSAQPVSTKQLVSKWGPRKSKKNRLFARNHFLKTHQAEVKSLEWKLYAYIQNALLSNMAPGAAFTEAVESFISRQHDTPNEACTPFNPDEVTKSAVGELGAQDATSILHSLPCDIKDFHMAKTYKLTDKQTSNWQLYICANVVPTHAAWFQITAGGSVFLSKWGCLAQ